MGGIFSKNETSNQVPVPNSKPTKHVSLLVIHNKDQQRNMDNFCKALNTYPPPSSMMINNPNDVEFAEDTDAGQKRNWVSRQLGKGHIVLVCLLVNFDLQTFVRGTNFENGNKIIAFRFTKPVVTYANWNCIEVTCNMDDPPSTIRQNMKELAAAIKADNR